MNYCARITMALGLSLAIIGNSHCSLSDRQIVRMNICLGIGTVVGVAYHGYKAFTQPSCVSYDSSPEAMCSGEHAERAWICACAALACAHAAYTSHRVSREIAQANDEWREEQRSRRRRRQ